MPCHAKGGTRYDCNIWSGRDQLFCYGQLGGRGGRGDCLRGDHPRCNRLSVQLVCQCFYFYSQPIEVLEAELLNGQKLQGPLTAKEVHDVLEEDGRVEE